MGGRSGPRITPEIAINLVKEEREKLVSKVGLKARPPAVLGERACPCGTTFTVLRHNPGQTFCSPGCALRMRTPEQKAAARRLAAERQKENRERALELLTKREAFGAGWRAGYQSGRHTYHWRRFLKNLKELLDGKPRSLAAGDAS